MASGDAMAGVSLWDATARQHAELSPDEQHAGILLLGELAHGEPVTIAHFAYVLGIPTAKAEVLVKDSALRRFINQDETDRIVGFIGLSLQPTHHLFVVNGRKLWTWCAQDALFLPELLGATAEIESTDPETGQTVRLTVSADRVEAVETDGIVVSLIQPGTMDQSSAARIMATACGHIFFFSSRASGENWQTKHGEPETILLSLGEAIAIAKRDNARLFGTEFAQRKGQASKEKSFSAKQAFLGCPTNACSDSFVFAEFFRKTGKATFANSA
jgi:alkylmercury lyase